MSREDIYTELIEASSITLEHYKDLKEKRGFTDETIKKNKFRSGNDQYISIVEKMKSSYSEKDLLEAGVLVPGRNSKPPRVTPALLEDRVIIPYLNESSRVY